MRDLLQILLRSSGIVDLFREHESRLDYLEEHLVSEELRPVNGVFLCKEDLEELLRLIKETADHVTVFDEHQASQPTPLQNRGWARWPVVEIRGRVRAAVVDQGDPIEDTLIVRLNSERWHQATATVSIDTAERSTACGGAKLLALRIHRFLGEQTRWYQRGVYSAARQEIDIVGHSIDLLKRHGPKVLGGGGVLALILAALGDREDGAVQFRSKVDDRRVAESTVCIQFDFRQDGQLDLLVVAGSDTLEVLASSEEVSKGEREYCWKIGSEASDALGTMGCYYRATFTSGGGITVRESELVDLGK